MRFVSESQRSGWPCRTEYDATISFGLLFEPEDCQYGTSRISQRKLPIVFLWSGRRRR